MYGFLDIISLIVLLSGRHDGVCLNQLSSKPPLYFRIHYFINFSPDRRQGTSTSSIMAESRVVQGYIDPNFPNPMTESSATIIIYGYDFVESADSR
jgi:hypothetical protein